MIPSKETHDPNFRRLRYVRYADDFLLGFVGPKSEAEEIKQQLRIFLQEQLKLELSEEKTLITHAKSEAARFLSYEITTIQQNTRRHNMGYTRGNRRSVNGRIGLKVPKDIIKEKCREYEWKGKAKHRTELIDRNDYDIVMTYQLEFRGLANYYRLAFNMSGTLKKVKRIMEISLLKTLAAKHKSKVITMARKYRAETVVEGKKYMVLQAIQPRASKKPLIAIWGGVSLSWDIRATIEEKPAKHYAPYSELEQRLLNDICGWCGSHDIEMHHVRAMKDLHEYPGRPKPEWVKRMIALRRKTIPLCRTCHMDVQFGRPMSREPISLEEFKAMQKEATKKLLTHAR